MSTTTSGARADAGSGTTSGGALRRQPLSLDEGGESGDQFPPPSLRARTKSMFQSFFGELIELQIDAMYLF